MIGLSIERYISMRIENRLRQLSIVLPQPAVPAANYVAFVKSGPLLIISGQLPVENGQMRYKGKVGRDCSLEDGIAAARLCAVNILAQVYDACARDWNVLGRCLRLGGFVNCTDDFTEQPAVINGASDLMVDILGDAGKHARAAVGVNALPFGASVEVEAMFELRL
jgi:enamine deaminase RidA (YjgF/YER057c/UK114 family)